MRFLPWGKTPKGVGSLNDLEQPLPKEGRIVTVTANKSNPNTQLKKLGGVV